MYAEIYVDGSYYHPHREFSYGGVIVNDGEIVKTFSGKGNDSDLVGMRNVAGEICGAMYAMQYCYDHNIDELTIYYDYAGIEAWATGAWKTNKVGTIRYKAFYDQMISRGLCIKFVKVPAHTGVEYNELADKLAKSALGI